MIEWLKKLKNSILERGIRLPLAYDPVSKKASITILFSWVSFWLTFASLILLHKIEGILPATAMSMLFWVIATVFYLIRNIQKAKIDLDDKSIDLEGGSTSSSSSSSQSSSEVSSTEASPDAPSES